MKEEYSFDLMSVSVMKFHTVVENKLNLQSIVLRRINVIAPLEASENGE